MKVRVPYRSRDDSLVDVGAAARVIDDRVERETVRELAAQAHAAGDRTAGDLIDRIERADPAQRRAIVNRARSAAGLQTIEQVDAIRRWEAAQPEESSAPPRDESGFSFQLCHEPKCSAGPIEPSTGLPAKTPARKWWCEQHRHLAADMDDWEVGSGLILGPSGIVNVAEQRAEAIQERERKRSREARRETRRAERAQAAAQRRADEKARREQLVRETPEGMPIP